MPNHVILNIVLDYETYDRLEFIAFMKGMTVEEVIIEALKLYLTSGVKIYYGCN